MSDYDGLFSAVVVENNDPDHRGRVKASIPELMTDPETGVVMASGWCEAKGAWGPGAGALNVPPVGSHIWVAMRHSTDGNVYQLIYEPGRFGADKNGSHTPAIGKGQDDETVELKGSIPFKVPTADTRLPMMDARGAVLPILREGKDDDIELPGVPTSANAGEYPWNRVLKTSSGIVVEVDDSPGAPRIHIWHPEGAYIEINGKGTITTRATKSWGETIEHATRHVGGDERVAIDENELKAVAKNSVERVGGRKVILAGELDIEARYNMLMNVEGNLVQNIGGRSLERYGAGRTVVVGADMSAQWLGRGDFTSMGSTNFLCMQALRANAVMGMAFSTQVPWTGPSGGIRFGALPGAPTATPLALATPLIAVLEALLLHADTHTHKDSSAGVTSTTLLPPVTAATVAPMGLIPTKILAGE